MLKIFADLLMHGEIKIERGTFILFNQKVALVPQTFFIELTKNAIGNPERTIELYETAKKIMWEVFAPKFKDRYKLPANNVVDWMKNIGELGGWGQFEIVDYDEKRKRAIVRIKDASIGSALKPSSEPVDHVIRGFMAGVASFLFNSDVDYVETKCVAKGDPFCEFIAKQKNEFLKEDLSFTRGQIRLLTSEGRNHEEK